MLIIFAWYFFNIRDKCTIYFLTIAIPIADYLALKKSFPIIPGWEKFTDCIQPRATSGSEQYIKPLPIFPRALRALNILHNISICGSC